jgi:glycerol-3-phosphate dehydrogenase (NAD+)
VEQGVTVDEIEKKELGGQKLQGTSTSRAVYEFLEKQGQLEKFPLFVFVHGEYPCSYIRG